MKAWMVFAAALLFAAPAAAGSVVEGPITAEVLSVYDGDTFTTSLQTWISDGEAMFLWTPTLKVRIDGIDTPEKGGRAKCDSERRKAEEARDKLVELIGPPKSVVLKNVRHGKFAGRFLAEVSSADGVDVAQALIQAGLARPYHGERREGWCGSNAAVRILLDSSNAVVRALSLGLR